VSFRQYPGYRTRSKRYELNNLTCRAAHKRPVRVFGRTAGGLFLRPGVQHTQIYKVDRIGPIYTPLCTQPNRGSREAPVVEQMSRNIREYLSFMIFSSSGKNVACDLSKKFSTKKLLSVSIREARRIRSQNPPVDDGHPRQDEAPRWGGVSPPPTLGAENIRP